MKVQNIQSQNTNFNGLIMPKKMTFYGPNWYKDVLSRENVLANTSIKECAENYDVVIKKQKISKKRDLTEREVMQLFAGGAGLGVLTGVAVALIDATSNLGTFLCAGAMGGLFGLNLGWLTANCMNNFKLTPNQHKYNIQIGKGYNEETGKFDVVIGQQHSVEDASDIRNIKIDKSGQILKNEYFKIRQ